MAKGIPPTVGNFFAVLSSLLTQYDVKESQREARGRGGHVNIYRLGHLLGAAHKAEESILSRVGKDETMTDEIAGALIAELADNFTVNRRTNEFDLPPLRKFYKQLDAFVSTGKNPSLIG